MSIESLMAATPQRQHKSRGRKPKEPKYDKSPHLMADIDKWIAFFQHVNTEQTDILRMRLERLYRLTYQMEQAKQT